MNINPLHNRGAAIGDHLHYMKVHTDPVRWPSRKEQINKARRIRRERQRRKGERVER